MGVVSATRNLLSKLAGQQFGGERDLYEVLGYPLTLTPHDHHARYRRGDIASRIVDAFPSATWREPPEIEGDPLAVQEFWSLAEQHNLFKMFHRLDRLMNLGHYGVLLLGLDGDTPMSEPAGTDHNLLYVKPHGERTAQVIRWDDDTSSPRFGLPIMYQISVGVAADQGIGTGRRILHVHHSRVLHVAESPLEDEVIGKPRLEPIWNRLMDLDKVLGSGAETYWQNAAKTTAYIADKDVEWDPEEREDIERQLEELSHGLRRDLRLRGVNPSVLSTATSDPSPNVSALLDIIAGTLAIPKRILVGSERGELSSAQDESNFASRITERREQWAVPVVLIPFARKLQAVGVIPPGPFNPLWPQQDSLGEEAKAGVAVSKTNALKNWASTPGAEIVVSPGELRGWLSLEGELPPGSSDFEPDLEGDDELSGI